MIRFVSRYGVLGRAILSRYVAERRLARDQIALDGRVIGVRANCASASHLIQP